MDVLPNASYVPGDSQLIQRLVYELKSQGIFDQFRKECMADVDTKPAYQNLKQRVEGSVTAFLKQQTWSPEMNKNQVREQLRKKLYDSGFLETGVERIVEQVVNPKINPVFFPKVEEVVYKFLGVEKPNAEIKAELKPVDLLPTDLEAVSPESVHSMKTDKDIKDEVKEEMKEEKVAEDMLQDSKNEDDESPPFEPLENVPENKEPVVSQEENSVDSYLSGFSDLQSHDSINTPDIKNKPTWSNQESQNSFNGSDTQFSSVTSDDTKMEICEDSESKLISDDSRKNENENKTEIDSSEEKVQTECNVEQVAKPELVEEKKEEKYEESKKVDEEKKHRSGDKKKDSKYKKSDRDRSRHKSESSSSSRNKHKEKRYKDKDYKDRGDKDKSKDKHKKKSTKDHDRDRDKSRDDKSKESKDKLKESKDKSKEDKDRKDKEKSSKSKEKVQEKSDKTRDKEKLRKDKSDDKDKSKSEKDKHRSKDSSKHRSSGSKHSSRGKERKESSSRKHERTDSQENSDKDKRKSKDHKREQKKDTKDDHYSFKDKNGNRRSFDRDSNDDHTGKSSKNKTSSASENSSQQPLQDTSTSSSSFYGSGESANSDAMEKSHEQPNGIHKLKLFKPKIASNFKEALKIMKIRKQMALLEKQNKLSLIEIAKNDEKNDIKEVTKENCNNTEKNPLNIQGISLSKENWEVLEAKLTQEMLFVNNSNYNDYDDIDGNSPTLESKEKDCEGTALAGNEKEIKVNDETEKMKVDCHEEFNKKEDNIDHTCVKNNLSVDKKQNSVSDHTNPEVQLCSSLDVKQELFIRLEDFKDKSDKSLTANETMHFNDDEKCTHLEPPDEKLLKKLTFLTNYKNSLQQSIKQDSEMPKNKTSPITKARKRKLNENVDFTNNNKEQSNDKKRTRNSSTSSNISNILCNNEMEISINQSFTLPLSPSESDKSNDKQENVLSTFVSTDKPKPKRNPSTIKRQQRYSNDDLYKPRPIIGSNLRRRSAKRNI